MGAQQPRRYPCAGASGGAAASGRRRQHTPGAPNTRRQPSARGGASAKTPAASSAGRSRGTPPAPTTLRAAQPGQRGHGRPGRLRSADAGGHGGRGGDPQALADLAKGKLRRKRTALEHALAGLVGPHQRFLLREQLAHLDELDARIARVSAELEARLRPFAAALAALQTIPGGGRATAEAIVCELGADLRRFPTAAHLASWAGVCPGQHESAGKRARGRTRKGNPWLRTALVEGAWAAARTKATYLRAQYHRLAARRGAKRALVAVAHTLLVIVYHVLTTGEIYRELGADYFDRRNQDALARRLVKRLTTLGYTVTVEPQAA